MEPIIPVQEYVISWQKSIWCRKLMNLYIIYIQVSVPSTGSLALDLMCGEYGASRCSATRWFHYMGTEEGNPFVPFQINYLTQPDEQPVNNFIPHNPKVTPCNESLNVSIIKMWDLGEPFILIILITPYRLIHQLVHV